MKYALINAPALAFPDYSVPFSLYTDASALVLGVFRRQPNARGKNHAIAYASRTVNQAEANYSVTHQETLAIVWALQHVRDIILGYPITVTKLFKGRNLTGKLARWYLTIQEFGPTFKYLPGLANVISDSLSRNVPVGSVVEMPSQIENFTLKDLAAAQRQHDVWSKVMFALDSGDETSPATACAFFTKFLISVQGLVSLLALQKGSCRAVCGSKELCTCGVERSA